MSEHVSLDIFRIIRPLGTARPSRPAHGRNQWTPPPSPPRAGDHRARLTPGPLPAGWLDQVAGWRILCLASGGGQQGPLLAAAGAEVTVFDASEQQLERDRLVARREGLSLATELGDMRDLSHFADGCFDCVFHPISNLYVPDVRPVWRECFRVLRPGGRLLSFSTRRPSSATATRSMRARV